MSFPWLDPIVPEAHARSFPAKRTAAWERDLEDRARVLMHLGHDEAAVSRRLAENLHWEFESAPRPVSKKDVDALVKRVFSRS